MFCRNRIDGFHTQPIKFKRLLLMLWPINLIDDIKDRFLLPSQNVGDLLVGEALDVGQQHGDPELLKPLDALLASFVRQRRMKLSGDYKPCYRIVA